MPKTGAIALHIFSGISIHLTTILIYVYRFEGMPYWPIASVYWLGFMVYWYVFGSFYTSMTLITLRALDSSPNKSLHLNKIFITCFENTFVERIESLNSLGLANINDGEICITDKGKNVSWALGILIKIFGIDSNGLYLVDEENK